MSDTVTKPFFTQLNNAFIALLLSAVAALSFIFFMFIWRDIQFQQVNDAGIPRLKYHYQSQLLVTQTLTAIDQFVQLPTANNINRQYQDLQQQYQVLTVFFNTQSPWKSRAQSKKIASLIAIKNDINYTAENINNNSVKNQRLLAESIYLFKGLAALLSPEIIAKNQQQAALLQQVLQDSITDRVTVRRARAYGKVSEKLITLNNLSQDLTLLLAKLQQVNMHTDLVFFELLQGEIDDFLVQAKISFSEQTEQKELVIMQLAQLEYLLAAPQNMLNKWHDQLRLYAQLKTALNQQKTILLTIRNNLAEVNIELAEQTLPNSHIDFVEKLKKTTYQLKLQVIPLTLLVASLSFLAILVFIIFHIRTRIKKADEHTLMMCEQLSETETEVPDNFHSSRDQQLAQFILANSQTLHNTYQALQTDNLHQLTTLAKDNDVAYWEMQPYAVGKSSASVLWKECLTDEKISTALKDNKSWRHYFDKTELLHLLSLARALKNTASNLDIDENSEVIILTTKAGKVIALSIHYHNNKFFGTLVNATLQNSLNKEIQQLTIASEADKQAVRHRNLANTRKLEQMLLRALLQCQSVSIGFDGTSFHVYRQLSRILDWCQQQLLSEELRQNTHSLQLADISLKGVLHSAILNAMCEARAQRNSITLKCDPQLMTRVELDSDLFQRLQLISCRLLLQECFKASLSCTLKVIDKRVGQQVVRFSYQLSSPKKRNHPPALLQLLCDIVQEESSTIGNDKDDDIPGIIRYAQQLLSLFQGTDLRLTPLEYGYNFSYNLPMVASENQQKEVFSVNFKQAYFLLISSQSKKISIVQQAISSANGCLEVLSSAETVAKRLTETELIRRPIAVVLFEMNNSLKEQQEYQLYIDKLPVHLQPKLMVMQAPLNAALHQQGFYSQSHQPLLSASFLAELSQLQQSDKQDNCLCSAELFNQPSYLPTQVEVLIAVNQPEQQQTLMRILQWLGLQITFVSDAETMNKYWYSGRYLILFTEFKQTPFITLNTGKSVHRGVFSFDEQQFLAIDLLNNKFAEQWYLGHINQGNNAEIKSEGNDFDMTQFAKLTKALKPWLKIKEKVLPSHLENKVTNKVFNSVESAENEVDSSGSFPPFDLQVYADNQGSPALAVIMLDEYLTDNQKQFNQLSVACQQIDENKGQQQAQQAITQLFIQAKTLAAGPLLAQLQVLQRLLDDENMKMIRSQLEKLQQVLSDIVTYAEGI
jgi:hypothetical protein